MFSGGSLLPGHTVLLGWVANFPLLCMSIGFTLKGGKKIFLLSDLANKEKITNGTSKYNHVTNNFSLDASN